MRAVKNEGVSQYLWAVGEVQVINDWDTVQAVHAVRDVRAVWELEVGQDICAVNDARPW